MPDGVTTKQVGLGGINVKVERLRALRDDTVKSLMESMTANGLLQPIVLRPRGTAGYWLVAGRHRFEAARKLKWDAIRATIVDDMNADTAELAEIEENLIRADLSPAERAMHVGRRKQLYEKLYPGTKQGGDRKSEKSSRQNGDLKRFTKDAVKQTGKSERGIQRDATRAKHIVVLPEIVGTSLDQGDELDALGKLSEPEQRKLAERAGAGDKVSAKTRVKQVQRADREFKLAASTAAAAVALKQEIPASVIVVDWALKFDVWSERGMDRSPENHYPCGTVEEMAALKPPMADHAAVFMWTSPPQLDNAMSILRAWDLTYKSYWGWDKEVDGAGYWGRSILELILIGIKGHKVPAPAQGEQPTQLFRARRGKHSEKPDIVYDEIARLYPNLVKLEMFARKKRVGWLTWGNEAEANHDAA